MGIKHRYVLVALREGAVLTPTQLFSIRAAVASLTARLENPQPCNLFQARLSLDGRKAIYEITYDEALTPWAAIQVAALAANLTVYDLLAVIEFNIFDESGTAAGSLEACENYIRDHIDEWERSP